MTRGEIADQVVSVPAAFHPLLLQITEYSTIASVAVIVWEVLITFGDEVKYIWSKPRGARVKWLYLFGKYFGIVSQIFNVALLLGLAEKIPVPIGWCRGYHSFQVAILELLLLAFDIVLLLRVYALYARNTLAMGLGASAILIEFITTVVAAALAIPATPYDPACLVFDTPTGIFIFMIGTAVSQTILLALAYRKKRNVVRVDHQRTSVAWVTIRDGILAFAAIISLLLMLLIYLVADADMANLTVYWFPVVLSVSTCRLIMNMQRAAHGECTHNFTTEVWGLDADPDSLLYHMRTI
ncbi:hypothetical protein HYDPIDRAFT_110403 [Hydnomerulius pinastri MD-312]|nr:hypothetical protein HYDPIDRAFT_110403 [Hydnomerulius pinastri MD-312]